MSVDSRAILKEKYNDNSYNDPSNAFLGDGILSTPQIEYYIKKYKIIEGFEPEFLKAAVYEMRLGDKAIRWNDKEALKFNIQEQPTNKTTNILSRIGSTIPGARYIWPINVSTSSLVLPPNSLTFVTIYEKFNLLRDIMARFNLKSVFVHKGLLLGGGPIIDPGYHSSLLVPLHNFSSIPITLNWREPLLKVEFSRTLNPDETKMDNIEVRGLRNERSNISEAEFFHNTEYIESSVFAAIEKNDDLVKSLSNRLKLATIASVIGLVALIVAFYNLIINVSNTANSATAKLHETQEKMTSFTIKNEKYLKDIDRQLNELIVELNHIRNTGDMSNIPDIEKQTQEIKSKIDLKN